MPDFGAAAREAHARRFATAAGPMLDELSKAGINVEDFGLFTSLRPTTFDYARAAPILIAWLPRIEEPAVVESIARSLVREPAARGVGARALIAAYRRMPPEESSVRWAIGFSLSTVAGPADADDLIELLQDRSTEDARQMLCDALTRTRDPRAADVLIDLVGDDTVAAHAILALGRLGRWKTLPQPERTRRELESLLGRPTATDFGRKQARKALTTLEDPTG